MFYLQLGSYTSNRAKWLPFVNSPWVGGLSL